MARLRYNGLTATLGAALLTADTTITFAAALSSAAGAVPTITGTDILPLTILDADGNVAEIIHLTAYTLGATTGTIARAQESTTAADHATGATVLNGLTVADVNEVVGTVPADQIPSLDEIAAGYTIPLTISTDVSYPIFIAPFALSVEAFSLSTFGLAITASDTDYWTIELRRVRGLTSTTYQTDVIAKRSTKATASAGDPAGTMPARGDWNFDAATFDSSFKVLQKGDIISVAFLKTGAPGTIGAPGGSVRYVPA